MSVRCAVLVVVATVAACGGTADTKLTITVENGVRKQVYDLRCDPPDGTVPSPARVCNLLSEHAEAMLFRETGRMCIGGLLTPHIYVDGRYQGRRVSNAVDTCAGNLEGERLWFEVLPPPSHP